MDTYSVQIVGLEAAQEGLRDIEQGVESLKPLWEKFQGEFEKQETGLFARAPWAPLKPSTVKRKQGGKGILRESDTLFKSLTQGSSEGAIRRMDDESAEFGTGISYAVFHQFGTGRMPARPPLAAPNVEAYATLAGQYVVELVEKAGFK